MTQLAVRVVAVVVPVMAQVIPVPAFTAVATVRLVPVSVTGTVVPLTPLVGEIEISPAPVAVPVSAAVCVPAASVTESVADSELSGSVTNGRNCTVIRQLAPTARVVWPSNWPPPAGPQV